MFAGAIQHQRAGRCLQIGSNGGNHAFVDQHGRLLQDSPRAACPDGRVPQQHIARLRRQAEPVVVVATQAVEEMPVPVMPGVDGVGQ